MGRRDLGNVPDMLENFGHSSLLSLVALLTVTGAFMDEITVLFEYHLKAPPLMA